MGYSFLPQELRDTAEQIRVHLKENDGLNHIEIEKAMVPNIEIAPTLCGRSPNGYLIFVEISNSPYPKTLDSLVVDCLTADVPIKLYVGNPASSSGSLNEKEMIRLSKKGIGYIIVGASGVEIIRDALELSLYLPNLPNIKRALKPAVSEALKTYRNGNPVKGVAVICDEIEHILRRIVKNGIKKGKIPSSVRVYPDKTRLARIVEIIDENKLIRSRSLLGKCSALPEIRNDSSHPPKNMKRRMERHRKLKTNFNWAFDLLKDLSVIK